ncbi:class I adenylate-forming enzyme family protein [Actinomadura litoris]|uniref:class I adenylate-forming enzyme family protein n=1 Tax=Actinomadura litoris TaxID=2678616 RepID=UPI001FA760B2|nr:fatty acid--CoA ligase family protein [Actinomadura litoris]
MRRPPGPQALVDAVRSAARRSPDRPALRGAGGEIGYGDLADRLASAEPGTDRRVLPVSGTVDDVVALLRLACGGHDVLLLDAAATAWEAERARGLFQGAGAEDGSPVLGLCTSGTTGLPKIVEVGWPELLANARACARALRFGERDVVWSTAAMPHRMSLDRALLAGLLSGATVVMRSGLLGPAEFHRTLLEGRVTVLLTIPFLYRGYVERLAREPGVVRSWALRACVAGGEVLPDDLRARWPEVTDLPLLPAYGTTEDGSLTLGRGDPGEGVGAPLEGVELTADASGEVMARHTWADGAPTPWRRTGDLGRLDDRGRLHLTGRRGELMNIGGRRVDPHEVEQALRMNGRVVDCVVAGTPGANGEEMVAFVVTDGDVPNAEMRRSLAALLSPHKLPSRFVRLPEIPRGLTGKARRGMLVADLMRRAEAEGR